MVGSSWATPSFTCGPGPRSWAALQRRSRVHSSGMPCAPYGPTYRMQATCWLGRSTTCTLMGAVCLAGRRRALPGLRTCLPCLLRRQPPDRQAVALIPKRARKARAKEGDLQHALMRMIAQCGGSLLDAQPLDEAEDRLAGPGAEHA